MKLVTIATGLILFTQVESEKMLLAYDPYVRFPSNAVTAVPNTAPSIVFPSNFGAQGFFQGFGGSFASPFSQLQIQQSGQQQQSGQFNQNIGQCFSQQVLPK